MLVTSKKFASVMDKIEKIDDWTLDTETTGLGMKDQLCGVSIRAGRKSYYFPFRHMMGPNLSLTKLALLLKEAPNHILHGFNVSAFDTRMCRRDGMGWVTTCDVMYAAFLVNENEPRNRGYGLERLGSHYIGPEATEQQRQMDRVLTDNLLTKGDICRLPAKIVAPYACEDVQLSDKLERFYHKYLEQQGLMEVWRGVSEYGQIMGCMLERGIPINRDRCNTELAIAKRMITETAMEIFEKEGHVIRVNSPAAAAKWLGVDSTKEEDLQAMKDSSGGEDWRIDILLKYRKLQRAISSYYKPMFDDSEEDGHLHPSIVLHGTVTGRPANWSGKGHMNALAIPRDTTTYKVKQCIEAPEGYVIVQADYRTAEMRLACHYGQEKRMARLLIAGKNIHKVTAKDLKMPYAAAKTTNFSVIYGIGAATLARRLNISEDAAAKYLAAYHKRYPGFRVLYKAAESRARRTGKIHMWTGRIRHYNRGPLTPHYKASDHLIQGGVNELLRTKQTELHHELPHVKQFLQVYDSAIMLVPEESVSEDVKAIREIMTYRDFTVPMEVDISKGKTLAGEEVIT